jgi:GT2 family glycosyltransferase
LIVNTKLVRTNHWLYYFTGCALAFDVEFIKKVGLMNEKFFMYGEDIELTYRALKENVPLKLLDNELVYHEGSKSAGMGSFFYEYHMTRMHYLLSFILFKNPLKKVISIFCKIPVLSCRAIIRSIRYKSWSPVIALIFAILPLRIRPSRENNYKALLQNFLNIRLN